MTIKKRPDLGALVLTYVCAIGIFILFGPSAYFSIFKSTAEGEIYKLDGPVTKVKYYTQKGEEYFTSTEGVYHKGELIEGGKVKVFYMESNPSNALLPDFDGYGLPLLYIIFLLMAAFVVFSMQRDYIKHK